MNCKPGQRYKILNALAAGQRTTRGIAGRVSLSRTTVHHHLSRLELDGVLSRGKSRKTGLALRRAARYNGVWYAGEPVEREN